MEGDLQDPPGPPPKKRRQRCRGGRRHKRNVIKLQMSEEEEVLAWVYDFAIKHECTHFCYKIEGYYNTTGKSPDFHGRKLGSLQHVRSLQILIDRANVSTKPDIEVLVKLLEDILSFKSFHFSGIEKGILKLYAGTKILLWKEEGLGPEVTLESWPEFQKKFGILADDLKEEYESCMSVVNKVTADPIDNEASGHQDVVEAAMECLNTELPGLLGQLQLLLPSTTIDKLLSNHRLRNSLEDKYVFEYSVLLKSLSSVSEVSLTEVVKTILPNFDLLIHNYSYDDNEKQMENGRLQEALVKRKLNFETSLEIDDLVDDLMIDGLEISSPTYLFNENKKLKAVTNSLSKKISAEVPDNPQTNGDSRGTTQGPVDTTNESDFSDLDEIMVDGLTIAKPKYSPSNQNNLQEYSCRISKRNDSENLTPDISTTQNTSSNISSTNSVSSPAPCIIPDVECLSSLVDDVSTSSPPNGSQNVNERFIEELDRMIVMIDNYSSTLKEKRDMYKRREMAQCS